MGQSAVRAIANRVNPILRSEKIPIEFCLEWSSKESLRAPLNADDGEKLMIDALKGDLSFKRLRLPPGGRQYLERAGMRTSLRHRHRL